MIRQTVKWVTAAGVTKAFFEYIAVPVIDRLSTEAGNFVAPPPLSVLPASSLNEAFYRQIGQYSVLVIGPPTSGKRSFVRHLQRASARRAFQLRPEAPSVDFRGVVSEARFTAGPCTQTITAMQPHAIVMMLDGRLGTRGIDAAAKAVHQWLIDALAANVRRPKAFYVGLNFADTWAESAEGARRRVRLAEELILAPFESNARLASTQVAAYELDLSPHRTESSAIDRFVSRLGSDLDR